MPKKHLDLVDILLATAILGVLAGIAAPRYFDKRQDAQAAIREQERIEEIHKKVRQKEETNYTQEIYDETRNYVYTVTYEPNQTLDEHQQQHSSQRDQTQQCALQEHP